ncbi:MAG: hypothetical protein HKO92_04505 [Flavobacteriaceae bacterium]|nr:hypothetical protein [Bacteroidia bacterium]NNK82363.1 hypothetical protein [Flavobacteriaceae bacterium]
MKRSLYIIAFLILPLFTMGQEKNEFSKIDIQSNLKSEITIKKIEPISSNPLEQIQLLNIKSEELISIKAYIKTLKVKRKETILG